MKSQIKRESKYSSPVLKRQEAAAVGGGGRFWGGSYAGNLATAGYLGRQAMTVSEPHDLSEQEAESTADQVMRTINRSPAKNGQGGIHRSADGIGGTQISPTLQSGIESAQSGPAGSLPASLAGSIGGAMGCTFANVRVHDNSAAHAMSRDLHAKAFTTGNDIFFGQGAYQPDSPTGQRLIAHELTHVAQEQGGVRRSPYGAVVRRNGDGQNDGVKIENVSDALQKLLEKPLLVRFIKLVNRLKKDPDNFNWAVLDVGSSEMFGKGLDAFSYTTDMLSGASDVTSSVADIGGKKVFGSERRAEEVSAGATLAYGEFTAASSIASMIGTGKDMNDKRQDTLDKKRAGLTGNNTDLATLTKDDYAGGGGNGSNWARMGGSLLSLSGGALGMASGIKGLEASGMPGKVNGEDNADKAAVEDTAGKLGFAGLVVGAAGSAVNFGADFADWKKSKVGGFGEDKMKQTRTDTLALFDQQFANVPSVKHKNITDEDKAKQTMRYALDNGIKASDSQRAEAMRAARAFQQLTLTGNLKTKVAQYSMMLEMQNKGEKGVSDKKWSMLSNAFDTANGALYATGSGFSVWGNETTGKVLTAIASGLSLVKGLYNTVKKTKKLATANSDKRLGKYQQRVATVIESLKTLPDIIGAGPNQINSPEDFKKDMDFGDDGRAGILKNAVEEYKSFYDGMGSTINMFDLCTTMDETALNNNNALGNDDRRKIASVIAEGLGR